MTKEKIFIFDTTLRDGAQTQGVDFSIDDKLKIAKALDDLGVDYIEGGWPGANPTDTEFFQKKIKLNNSILTAFGMTKRSGRSADNDPGLSSILNSNTPAVCLVGKSWDFHVDVALGISNEENLENISESAKLFVKEKKEFMFDAEHFFDGFKNNKEYALSCIKSAYDNGARWVVLCDTNGGTLPNEVTDIVNEVIKSVPGKNIGIHSIIFNKAGDEVQVKIDVKIKVKLGFITIYKYIHENSNCKVLWASCRMSYDYILAQECGADIITMQPNLAKKIVLFGKSSLEYSKDTVKGFFDDAKSSGFVL